MRNATCMPNTQPQTLSQDMSCVREHFPAIKKYPETIFFDNSATTQKPYTVIETIRSFYEDRCANSNRAAYALAGKLHHQVEETRQHVAKFINAESTDIAFTSGATDSLNLVANSWGMANLCDGDQIMLCLEDHQSAILPWFNLISQLERFGKNIEIVPFSMHHTGVYDRSDLKTKITAKTCLVAMSHIHHLYGLEWDQNDIAELKAQLPKHALISLDASQSIGHTRIDTQALNVEFISFSGHKLFAANGVGVLWIHPNIKSSLWPVRLGSKSAAQIIENRIHMDKSNLSGLLECGTLNLPAIFSFKSALDFIEKIGITNIEKYLSHLTRYLYQKLKKMPGIEFAPGVASYNCAKGFGIIGFRITNISSSDLAQYLDQQGVFVRSGDHCLGIKANQEIDYIRVSLHIYNTEEEVDSLIQILEAAL